MGNIEKIFNRHTSELTKADLEEYFKEPQEESSLIEFKSGDVEVIDIYKEIAAFLNTEGGILIIGSPRENKIKEGKTEKNICQGELTYSNFRNKDWLYQKIASNIVPTPTGLKIAEFLDIKGSIFVIDIPQSYNPPHQCSSDGKYYIRMEREAKPAPHGLVQALFQKRRLPTIDADIDIEWLEEDVNEIKIGIKNNTSIPADKVGFLVELYNVNEVISSEQSFKVGPDFLGRKFSASGRIDQILARVISFDVKFTVINKSDEYIIFVGYWCKNKDFDFKFWTINPNIREIVCEDRMEFEKTSFLDEIERVTKITIPKIG